MNAAQHNTLKKDFGYEILFLKTTIDLNVNVKYVKLQHFTQMYGEKKKDIMLYIFGQWQLLLPINNSHQAY